MFVMMIAMGLFAIADLVYRKGYSTQILHLGVEKIEDPGFSLRGYLEEVQPKIVGLSLQWQNQSYDAIQVAKEIKAINSKIFVVLGGLTASYFYEEIMEKFSFIDAIIKGEGEIPFLKAVEEVTSGNPDLSKVPNLVWREKGKIRDNPITYVAGNDDLDGLNFTNFKLLKNFQAYRSLAKRFFYVKGISKSANSALMSFPSSMFPIFTSRGCPVNCPYCGGGQAAQEIINRRSGVNVRSVDKVIESIKDAQEHNYETIYINYLPLKNDQFYFDKLFEKIKNERIKIGCILDCWALPPKELILKFKEAFPKTSNFAISISPQSGSERVRRLNRGFYFSNEELLQILAHISELKIHTALFFSFGVAFENLHDVKETKSLQNLLARKFGNLVSFPVYAMPLDPGSSAFMNPGKFGIVNTRSSFMDFFNAYKDQDASPLSASSLGYYSSGLVQLGRPGRSSKQKTFERRMQTIQCRYFCILSNFITYRFKLFKVPLLDGLVSLSARMFCSTLSVYWKCKNLKRLDVKGKEEDYVN